MSTFDLSQALAQAVDDYIAWYAQWSRVAFLDLGKRAQQSEAMIAPASFGAWQHKAIQSLPQDQPAVDGLGALHEQLHTFVRLVLMKTPDGKPVSREDFEAITAKYNEVMHGLRLLERAFGAATSGLDTLTGLRSRVGLEEDLTREYSRFTRTNKAFCVAIMDIDHFKAINDTHGHDAGDNVLAAVADHISRGLRPFDDAYRLGGEEFLLCLKEVDEPGGLMIVERLRAGLQKKQIKLANGKSIPVTASFGIVESSKNRTPDEMIKAADKALYRAKELGRDRIELAR